MTIDSEKWARRFAYMRKHPLVTLSAVVDTVAFLIGLSAPDNQFAFGLGLICFAQIALWFAWVVFLEDVAGALIDTFKPGPSFFTQDDWVRHRHCGDWLHGGLCPDPSWHSRHGSQQPPMSGTSAGTGQGDGL